MSVCEFKHLIKITREIKWGIFSFFFYFYLKTSSFKHFDKWGLFYFSSVVVITLEIVSARGSLFSPSIRPVSNEISTTFSIVPTRGKKIGSNLHNPQHISPKYRKSKYTKNKKVKEKLLIYITVEYINWTL